MGAQMDSTTIASDWGKLTVQLNILQVEMTIVCFFFSEFRLHMLYRISDHLCVATV